MSAPAAAILGMGLATPTYSARQPQTTALALAATLEDPSQAALVAGLYSRAGVDRRGSVLLRSETGDGHGPDQSVFPSSTGEHWPTTADRMRVFDQHATGLALEAARRALADAGVLPGQITDLLTVSCTGLSSPGVDVSLMTGLPMAADVRRVNIGFMGCHGAIVALRTAADLVASGMSSGGRERRVLVVCTELCSLHLQRTSRVDQHVSNALFADGCAAAVIGAATPRNALRIVGSSSMLFAGSEAAMGWHIGDHGFSMSLDRSVPALLERSLEAWIWPWLRSHLGNAAGADDVRWAIHPGGPRVLDAVAQSLGLDDAHVRESRAVLRDHGNMSSPTVLFIANRHRARRDDRRPIALLAFGPGLSGEASLLAVRADEN